MSKLSKTQKEKIDKAIKLLTSHDMVVLSQSDYMDLVEKSDPSYCPTCGACGESGCCNPSTCKCLYGDTFKRDYREIERDCNKYYEKLLQISDIIDKHLSEKRNKISNSEKNTQFNITDMC